MRKLGTEEKLMLLAATGVVAALSAAIFIGDSVLVILEAIGG